MNQDSSSTEPVKYYDWFDYTLSTEEFYLIEQEDKGLSPKERLLKRIAFTKTRINPLNAACRKILSQFPIQQGVIFEDGTVGDAVLQPHELDFRTRCEPPEFKALLDKLARERTDYRHPVYFEDNPIYHAYFRITEQREEAAMSLKLLQRKFERMEKRKKKPTDSKKVMT